MNEHKIRQFLVAAAVSSLSILSTSMVNAQSLDEVLGVRATTTQDGRKSQTKIDEITEDTRDLLSQYKTVMKVVDGLQIYNKQQERLIAKQDRKSVV